MPCFLSTNKEQHECCRVVYRQQAPSRVCAQLESRQATSRRYARTRLTIQAMVIVAVCGVLLCVVAVCGVLLCVCVCGGQW
jgi:hypothetical protein